MESDGYIKSGNCVMGSGMIKTIISSRYETKHVYSLLKGVYPELFF